MEDIMERETVSREEEKEIICEDGKIYYRGSSERKVYFFMTLIMLVVGILYKFGIIG